MALVQVLNLAKFSSGTTRQAECHFRIHWHKYSLRSLGGEWRGIVSSCTKGQLQLLGETKSSRQTEEQPWIKRVRTSGGTEVEDSGWKVDLGLETILDDLDIMRRLRKEDVVQDYYQFVIIDRLSSKEDSNKIFHEVGMILYELSKRTSLQAKTNEVIRSCIPESQQDSYIGAITVDELPCEMKRTETLHYVGARNRATDVDASFIRLQAPAKVTLFSYIKRSAILDDLEKNGVIKRLEKYTPPLCRCVLLQSTDGNHDLYFDHRYSEATKQQLITKFQGMQLTRSSDCLHDFVMSYLTRHQNAIFTRGRILLNYCAWPMPNSATNWTTFSSPKGYLYNWEKLPFDWPASTQAWNYCLENWMNRQYPFVLFWNNSFVICANDVTDAAANSTSVLAEARKQGIDLELDQPESWVNDTDAIDLRLEWNGVYPAGYKRT